MNKAHKKITLYLLFDEIAENTEDEGLFIDINRLQCCNALKYVLEKGTYTILSFSPYTAKYIRFANFDGDVTIKNFGIVSYENPNENLKFCCNDKNLTLIIDAARATFRQNAVDILTDCPSRERAGWLCDSYFTARAENFLTGKNAIEKNFCIAFCSLQTCLLPKA